MSKESVAELKSRLYKNQIDGTSLFLGLVFDQLSPDSNVLDLGCGIGHKKKDFRFKAKLVVGCEISSAVNNNSFIHYGVRGSAYDLPFKSNTVHLIFMDYVLEHLEFPEKCAREVVRVLKPGGILLFRTPNIYHYASMIGFLTPHFVHRLLANRVRGLSGSSEADIFPTFHRANTRRKIIGIFSGAGLMAEKILMVEREPSYLMFSKIAFRVGYLYERIVNKFKILEFLRANIFGIMRKTR